MPSLLVRATRPSTRTSDIASPAVQRCMFRFRDKFRRSAHRLVVTTPFADDVRNTLDLLAGSPKLDSPSFVHTATAEHGTYCQPPALAGGSSSPTFLALGQLLFKSLRRDRRSGTRSSASGRRRWRRFAGRCARRARDR